MIYGITKCECTCMCACVFPDPEETQGQEVDFSMAQPHAEAKAGFWFKIEAIRWANARRDSLSIDQNVDFRSIRTEVRKDGDYNWMAVVTYCQI